MPSYTYTLEDYSPLITYSSDWSQGTSASDGLAYRYSQSSFQATNHAGATAKFSFNGTGVAIYGAKRDNHGLYQVTVDGSAGSPLNGLDTGNTFQTILFEVHNLSLGKHDVVVTNLDQNKYLDIDFVTVDGVVGSTSSGQTFVNAFQDSDSTFSYLPSTDAWSTAPSNLGTFSGSSGHITSRSGASVSFAFSGDGVSLYGPLSTDGSPYSVQLDGQAVLNSTTVRDRYWPQALLFQGMNLGEGKHNLQVFYQSTASGQNFAVDYANVYTTSKSGSSSSGSSGLSAGAAAGITVACFVIVGLIGAIIFLLTNKRRQSTPKEPLEKPNASPLMQHDHFAANSQTALTRSNFGSIVSHGNPTFSTAPSSPEMSSGYLPTMASVGHQGYADPVPMASGATRLEWRQSTYDQNLVTVVDSNPRRESSSGSQPQQRLGPNGFPLEKRSRNELAFVSGHDEAESSDQFSPPGYAQSVQAGGQSYTH